MKDTPKRVAKAWLELAEGFYNTEEKLQEILRAKFPSDYDEMVIVRNIETVGLCPHHFLPILYDISIGYIPDKDGFVVGLSKLPRLAELLSSKPILQEQLAVDICATLVNNLNPRGVGVIIVGRHGCMNCRGVKMRDADTVTTKLWGCILRNEDNAKEEFLMHSYASSNFRK
jgi:GTP cyclohydrolase I